MRRNLMIALGCILMAAGCFYAVPKAILKWQDYRLKILDEEARIYLNQTLPQIFSSLSKQDLEKHLDEAFLSDEESHEGLDRALGTWKQLGSFQKIERVDFIKRIPELERALFYTAELRFQKGNVEVTVVVERQRDEWMYRYLNTDLQTIASPYMFRNQGY